MAVTNHLEKETTSLEYAQPHIAYLFIGSFLAVVGLTGNVLSCCLVGCRSKLRTPTFTSFACLAFVDIVAIGIRYPILWFYCITVHVDNLKLFLIIYFAVGFVTLHCSCAHIVLIASVRYVVLSRPLFGFLLKQTTILRFSLAIWAYSIALGVSYGVYLFYRPTDFNDHIVEFCIGMYLLLGTIVPIVILHVKKVKRLRRTLSNARVSSRRMSCILFLITLIHVISIAPFTVENLTFIINESLTGKTLEFLKDLEYFYQVCLLLLSHGVNPIIFFALSKSGKAYFSGYVKHLKCCGSSGHQLNTTHVAIKDHCSHKSQEISSLNISEPRSGCKTNTSSLL